MPVFIVYRTQGGRLLCLLFLQYPVEYLGVARLTTPDPFDQTCPPSSRSYTSCNGLSSVSFVGGRAKEPCYTLTRHAMDLLGWK